MTATLTRPGPLTVALPTSGIHVLRWPPGHGKSTQTREAIAADPSVKRVIWAVHSTVKEQSLGREAVAHFEELGVKATLVHGWEILESDRKAEQYRAQMEWTGEQEVKVVSFAHLPHIYDRHDRLSNMQADLLVIDELPMPGLVHSAGLRSCTRVGSAGALPDAKKRVCRTSSFRGSALPFWQSGSWLCLPVRISSAA